MLQHRWLVLLISVAPAVAQAHFALVSPTSRDPNGIYQSIPPCGGLPAGAATSWRPGATVNVQWRNLIAHPGTFRISLAAQASDFTKSVLIKDIASADNTADQNVTITLPTTPCAPCVLQVVQVNTSATDGTTPSGYVEYVACADVSIDDGAPGTSGGSASTTGSSSTGTGGTAEAPGAARTPAGGCAATGASEGSWMLLTAAGLWTRFARRRDAARARR